MEKKFAQFSNYHRVLRVAAVVFALMLVFDSGIISESTAKLSNGTQNYLANAVGMTASVAPTDLNQFTAQLTERERELSSREQALREREIEVGINSGGQTNDYSTYLLASILFIMLVLILLNYVLDYIRSREKTLVSE